MIPYKTSIHLNREGGRPLYLQLSSQLIELIKDQTIPPKSRLPSSRVLADLLGVHRKTVVACYEDLNMQGWVETRPKKGTFVLSNLPVLNLKDYSNEGFISQPKSSGFDYYKYKVPAKFGGIKKHEFIYINDGISDSRLTPIHDITRTYRRISSRRSVFDHLSYTTTLGNDSLREVLVSYLNKTRGLSIKKENILITRGSQMGIWLSSKLLLKNEDIVITGKTNYQSADITFELQGARLRRVSVDEEGLVTNEIEELCKIHKIKAVYVTSHHHHPTTVTLSAKRRIHLLNLARQYRFAIMEDDYDFDFNYNQAPILPLASHDKNGNVIYIGSICKTVAPVFRIGYLIASKQFVLEASKMRGYIDRQGDSLLELTFAEFIKSGDLDRHIRKVFKIYRKRRDLFCSLLKAELAEYFEFDVPNGGMAVWVRLNSKYTWESISNIGKKYKLEVGDWKRYDRFGQDHNSIRIGFAAYNEEEIKLLVARLKIIFSNLDN